MPGLIFSGAVVRLKIGYENKNPRSCVDFIVLVMRMRFSKTS
ncbi:Hypothetical protein ABZS17D1_01899 [Kosakonia cowanii]